MNHLRPMIFHWIVLSVLSIPCTLALAQQTPPTVPSLEERALAMIDAGTPERAHKAALMIVEGKREQLRERLLPLDEAGRLQLLADLRPYDVAASVGAGPALAEAALMAKGIVLESLLAERRQRRTPKDSQSLAPTDDVEAGNTLRSLSITTAEVAATLPQDMALIEYVRFERYLGQGRSEPSYAAAVIRPDAPPAFVPCGPAAPIEDVIRIYRAGIQKVAEGVHDDAAILQLGQALHRALINGLIPHLKGVQRIAICPDGLLNFVPFGVLPDTRGGLLAEKGLIYYVASGRDLIGRSEIGAWIKSAPLLVGDPDFGGETLALSALIPLPGTRTEVAGVVAALGVRTTTKAVPSTLMGAEANEAAIRNLRNPEILHLASHGFFLPGDGAAGANPMTRSGLALSGAQASLVAWQNGQATPSDTDGLLLASEIGDLDLRGTDLVTLSACQTALGENVPGEGVMGMRRAFAMAGARNVLMTLWDIADEPTAAFMKDFYQRYAATSNAPQALAEVQRAWLLRLRKEEGLGVATYLSAPFLISAQAPRQAVNSLGMRFVEVPGTDILMSIWETRVQDYQAYARENPGIDMSWKDVTYSRLEAIESSLAKWMLSTPVSKGGFSADQIKSLSENPERQEPDHPHHPVVNVSWDDAQAFCKWLSARERLHYRLPTDLEWSIAVGIAKFENPRDSPEVKGEKNLNRYVWGNSWPPPPRAGNFNGLESPEPNKMGEYEDSHPFTAPVGSYTATRLGLFDLGGNVEEWCEDWYNSSEPKRKVYRGGSWSSGFTVGETLLASSRRFGSEPSGRSKTVGFRVVLSTDAPND